MGTAAAERGVVDLIAERVVDADDAGRTAYRVQERFDEPPPLQLSGQHDHTVVHRDIDRGQIKVAPQLRRSVRGRLMRGRSSADGLHRFDRWMLLTPDRLGKTGGARPACGSRHLLPAGHRGLPGRALPRGHARPERELAAQRPRCRGTGGAAPWPPRGFASPRGRSRRPRADPRCYLAVAPGGRAHIPVDRRAPLEEFDRIAAQVPVFRIKADHR